ncbi:MAG: QueT transporter family protein [Candidatus Bathyarchaeales archaeon]
MNVKDLALAVIVAALYAVLVVALAGISFQLVQVRVADALIPLSIVLGWPAVVGVTVGCVISNVVTPMPSVLVDITFGATANFFASALAWKIGKLKHGRIRDAGVSFVLVAMLASLSLFSWTTLNAGFFGGPWFAGRGLEFVNGALNSVFFVLYLLIFVWIAAHFRIEGRVSDFLGCLAATVTVTFIVGTYLAWLTEMELWVWWLGVGTGSLISICGIGYLLLQVLRRIEIR